MIEKAVEGVIVGVSKHYTGAGPGGLAVKGPILLLAVLKLPTGSLKALHLIIYIEASAPLGALVRQPEDFPSSVVPS